MIVHPCDNSYPGQYAQIDLSKEVTEFVLAAVGM
jgi:hypothetical protein